MTPLTYPDGRWLPVRCSATSFIGAHRGHGVPRCPTPKGRDAGRSVRGRRPRWVLPDDRRNTCRRATANAGEN